MYFLIYFLLLEYLASLFTAYDFYIHLVIIIQILLSVVIK